MAYTAPPVQFDHELVIGDTYQPAEVQLTDGAGAGVSLSGATGEMQLRQEPGAVLIASGTVSIVSASEGIFSWSISAATTAALVPGTAQFSVRITFGDGTKRTVIEGTVTIRRAVVA